MPKKEEYDVIIVGAGVSGIMLAHFLENSTLKVLLIEKRNTVKQLENSRFGSNIEPIDRYGLSKAVIKKYNRFAFGGRKVKDWFYYVHKNKPFAFIDLNRIVKDFKLDCKIKTNTIIKRAKRTKQGIIVYDQNKNAYLGKIVVDCSGTAKIVSNALGYEDEREEYGYHNISYELDNCNLPKNVVELPSFPLISFKYQNLPLWIYPESSKKCQLGKAEFTAKHKFPVIKNHEKYLKFIMKNIEPYKTWFKKAKITRRIEQLTAQTINRPFADDNFLACGNAAGATPPILGDGSRSAIEMASSAREVISEAFDLNDFSKKRLQKHEENFNEILGKYYPMNERMGMIWLRYVTDKEFKMIVENFSNLTPQEYIQFYRSEIGWKMFFKLFTLKTMFYLFINMIKYHLGGNKILTKRELK